MLGRQFAKVILCLCFITIAASEQQDNGIASVTWDASAPDSVTSLPQIGPMPTPTYSGLVLVNETIGAHLFYMFVGCSNPKNSTPVIVWLQGGPGCASEFGLFVEWGPWLIQTNGSFVNNPFSWTNVAHMLIVDNPVGYSYADSFKNDTKNEETYTTDLFTTLTTFFSLHQEYKQNPFYVAGESFGGQYVPDISSYIINFNKRNPGSAQTINFKGMLLGDGWVSPLDQSATYCSYLDKKGLVNESAVEVQDQMMKLYTKYIENDDWERANIVGETMSIYCNVRAGCIDIYNIDYKCFQDPTNGPSDALNVYLNASNTKNSLHVNNSVRYSGCNHMAYLEMHQTESRSTKQQVATILDTYPVLAWTGGLDYICNYMGAEKWTTNITWKGAETYNNSPYSPWNINGEEYGSVRQYSNLIHAIIDQAGHMVPFYQPLATMTIIQQWTSSAKVYNTTNGNFIALFD